jgi:hypothetical protein
MDRRSFMGLGVLVMGASLLGCVPAWHVVVQAMPNPLQGQRRFAVLPIDYAALNIGLKTEAQYLSEKDSKQQASFQEDKAGLNEKFLERLRAVAREGGIDVVPATGPADAPFLIRPSIPFIEPGFYAAVAAMPSKVEMNLKITTPDGRVLDEITIMHGTQSGMFNPASGQRLRSDGEGLGTVAGKYLLFRTGAGG